ncbi:MAG: GntR family transcriptional regulator, partial [Anaerolineae bacterium]|nr:GntR family transcriptional regulator [Anaerolineae bacterium]
MINLSRQIKLDFRSDTPLYLQIVRQIENLVTVGDLKQGDQLPTVRELAVELRINFNTVARAYRVLDVNGLISTQRGRGTYIWEKPLNERGRDEIRKNRLTELTGRFLEELYQLGYE